MKKSAFLTIMVMVLLSFGFAVSAVSAKPIVLTYASGYGENFSLTQHDRWWAQEVEKRTKTYKPVGEGEPFFSR